ncbi:glycerol-3-phosphate dehydrogenase [Microbacterium foliorum]|jgi:glycerol-3-phosphate dehydrogenase|uniref:Glycerol-3-phosphate dehydrogenase n=1 Tax=Microbacterium foliorum TaxID=104336 RepID=A0ABU1HMV1_9MICO|nr:MULTISPECIES: glycerol-3-phosphate dehydrogenase/oxidase [Microbacterium]KIP88114.1 FAD-dependent oxidoreductase [Microbacterium sp. MEJ108Y]KQR45379.1 FAD-dependent oxidoreductase [Microbacterium sp. Leaf161]MDR6141373.1 glycerol-3-phosphate dehydrogenase [Microbacterium foliorum]
MIESTHSSPERAEVRAVRESGRTSVLVIGAGINGISTFRDLALQGVDVLLVERGDFASGASAASSHMIHGGIRYLENGEFRLVRESVEERNGLLKIAPHYVKPLETTIPIYSTFSGILSAPLRFLTHKSGKPQERGAFLIKVGLTIYDTFSRDGGMVPRHRFLGRKRSLAELPSLDPNIKYTATYYDASMHDPERLALDVLQDGRAAHPGAVALNYVEAIARDGKKIVLRDRESGTEFSVAADVVVNASGPWTDLTNDALGNDTRFMGGTKGSHIVLDHPELLEATRGREIFFEHSDGRIVLIYPLKGRVLVGTTDIDADPREAAVCTEEEIDYFFDLIHHVFPTIDVTREQIVFNFSGIRPLPRHEDTAPGFVSRDYRIEVDDKGAAPLVSLVGGKWTTFRALGESLSDVVLDLIGRTRTVSTAGRAIGGGRDFPRTEKARRIWIQENLPGAGDRAERLLARYGTRAAQVWEFIEQGDDAPLAGDDLSTRELAWMVENEMVARLQDVVMRRTSIAFTGHADADVLEELAAALAPLLHWDRARQDAELDQTRTMLNERHGLQISSRARG